jgi:alpha-galactosidase
MFVLDGRRIVALFCISAIGCLAGCGGDVAKDGTAKSGPTTVSNPGSTTPSTPATLSSPGSATTNPPATVSNPASANTSAVAGPATPPAAGVINDVAAAPPLLGWTSRISLGAKTSYSAIQAEANGLAALNAQIPSGASYQYVNIGEGWWTSGERDVNANFSVDATQWPGGMPAVAQYIHGKGLKAGIYIDAGSSGCTRQTSGASFAGSIPLYYGSDFLQFAQWGFDLVTVGFCGGQTAGYSPEVAYAAIAQAIQAAATQTGHPMMLAVSDAGEVPGQSTFPDIGEGPWSWGAGVAASWRTGSDIDDPGTSAPQFSTVAANFSNNYYPASQHTGYYNDPDVLVTGMGMSAVNDAAQVSLWAISGAPMILGNDVSSPLAASTTSLLTNPEVIAIDQDPLGLQGLQVASGSQQIWAKRLAGTGQRAVLLFNNSNGAASISVTWQQLGLAPASQASVRDVWARQNLGSFAGSYTASAVPAGAVILLNLSGTDGPTSTYQPSFLSDGASYTPCVTCASGQSVTELGTAVFSNIVSAQQGGYVKIAYLNANAQNELGQLSVNGWYQTMLSFPPTGSDGSVGAITVYVPLNAGSNTLSLSNTNLNNIALPLASLGQTGALTLSSLFGTSSAPEIVSVATVAGPIAVQAAPNPLFPPPPPTEIYEAASSSNKVAGGAVVVACSACQGGEKVGYIGMGGTLTFNNVSVAASGTYSLQIFYENADSVARTALVSFNGGLATNVSFPPSGGAFETMTVTGQFLSGASNTVEISNPTGYGPDTAGLSAPTLVPN